MRADANAFRATAELRVTFAPPHLNPSRVPALGMRLGGLLAAVARHQTRPRVPPPLSIMTLHRALFRLAGWDSPMDRNLLRSSSPSRSCAFASSRAAMEDIENNRELFEFTSGRWMYLKVCSNSVFCSKIFLINCSPVLQLQRTSPSGRTTFSI